MKLDAASRPTARLSLVLATILAIFVLDLLTPLETVVWAVYTVPLLLSAMFARWWAPLACAILCTALIVLGFYFSHPPPASMDTVMYSRLSGSAVLWAMALILIRSRRLGTSLTMRTEQARVQTNLLNEAQDAIIVRDLENRILYWNRGAAERYGWFEKEAIGRNAHDLLRTQFPGPLHDIMEQTLRDGRWQGELTQSTRDGDQIYVASRWTVQKDADGHTQAILEINTDITAQRHMVNELRASERRVRTVIENALDAVIGMDERGLVTEWNPQAESIFGWTREEVLGRNLAETIIPPEYRERHHAGLERFLTAGEAAVLNRRLEMRALHRSGTQLFIELKVSAMMENGAHRFTAFITDITERVRVERQLKTQREILQKIFDHVPTMIALFDEDGHLQLVNRAWERWRGWTLEEVQSQHIDLLKEGYPDSEYRQEVLSFARRADGKWMDLKTRMRDGHIADTSWAIVRLSDGIRIGIGYDISERKRAEGALRESQARFGKAFSEAPIGMALVATDGRWLQVNRALCQIVGYSEDELLATNFQSITHPEDLEADLAQARRLLDGTIPSYQMEKRYVHKLGHVVWIQLTGSLVRDANGAPLYAIAQIQDITDRRRTEEALRSNELVLRTLVKEREQLMQNLHDGIIQSFYAIGMSVDECRRLTDEDPIKAGLKLGQTVGDINRVIREVRHQLVQSKDDLPFSAHRLKTELARVAATMERANALHFNLKVDPRAAECLTTEERREILYIAQETMSNCLRHSGASVAQVSLRLGRDRVYLEVEDDGKGFDPTSLLETNGGLRNIERRAVKVGAKVEIVSRREHGTRIRLIVPIHD